MTDKLKAQVEECLKRISTLEDRTVNMEEDLRCTQVELEALENSVTNLEGKVEVLEEEE